MLHRVLDETTSTYVDGGPSVVYLHLVHVAFLKLHVCRISDRTLQYFSSIPCPYSSLLVFGLQAGSSNAPKSYTFFTVFHVRDCMLCMIEALGVPSLAITVQVS